MVPQGELPLHGNGGKEIPLSMKSKPETIINYI